MGRRVFAAVLGAVALATSLLSTASFAVSPRIVNGAPAEPGTLGYVLSILDRGRLATEGAFQSQFCAGALTTPTTVVTAAHCLVNQKSGRVMEPTEIAVGVGATLRNPDPSLLDVASIAVHPAYEIDTAANDVAVITLAAPAVAVPTVLPHRPTDEPVAAGSSAVVAGWGNRSRIGNNFPDSLHVGTIEIFPDDTCGGGRNTTVGRTTFVGFRSDEADPAIMICGAGVAPTGGIIDACVGDSGGPLVAGTGPATRLIGVVSWGEDCATTHPGVYARMSAMTDFLLAHRAIATLAPTLPPTVTAEPLSQAVRISFAPAPDASAVDTFAAVVTNPATGASAACFAKPRRDALPATCTVGGLANGVAVQITGIAANGLGDSPASAPITVTPEPVPDPGRIRRVRVLPGGTAVFTVTGSTSTAAPITRERVVCEPLRGGEARRARVVDRRATMYRLEPVAYACRLEAMNDVGSAASASRLVVGR